MPSASPPDETTDVLIVGASLVGLSAALQLRLHGLDCLAVERHASTAIHPRAGHFHLRTMEILRAAGLEDAVRHRSEQQYLPNGGINNVESLAGREIASYFDNLNAGVDTISPTVRTFIDQDALEPILRRRAEELGARLRYRMECVSIDEDGDGVTITVREMDTGADHRVRARWVIACDGNRSPTRESLGIEMRGHGLLSHSVTIYFKAEEDLGPLLAGRNQGVSYVTNSVLRGFFRLDRSGNRGFLVVNLIGDSARPEIVAAYPSAPWASVADSIDERRALELVRAAIGVPEMPVTIRDVVTWRAVADSAERYQSRPPGRVFLAGDAAHVVPPNGGFGGNTGVQDVHNLAWKLGFVHHGYAGPELLDSYDSERRPIGELTVEQAYARYVNRVAPYLGLDTAQPIVDDFSLEAGYRYNVGAVRLEPGDDGALHEDPRSSRARPGSRVPHVWLERDGERLSTLDLCGAAELVLLAGEAGPDGNAWPASCRRAADRLGVPLTCHRVGDGGLTDPDGRFADACGISTAGAVLLRPDGFVAWRADDATQADALTDVVSAILARD